jgi:hypothetical protein
MKKTLASFTFVSLSVFLLSILAGCEKDENPQADMYNISATMNPGQETGTLNGSPSGSGTTTGTYNADNNTLQYNITWTGLTAQASAGHFHGPALAGENAGPIVTLTLNNTGTSGNASGSTTLTDAQETDLLAGKWYVNIHTATNTGGEIRGQVSAVK